MNEATAALVYLQDTLAADAELAGLVNGIRGRTTEGTLPSPFVKIERLDGNDLMVVGLNRIWADLTFLIRGILKWQGRGNPDWTSAQAIADRIDTVLHGYEGSSATLEVHAFREEPFEDETVEGGDLYLHSGGIYRVRAKAV